MRELPPSVRPYKVTKTFDEHNVPPGLLRAHRTKRGVWGRILVESGELSYRIVESGEEHRLTSACPGVIEPEVLHEVALVGPVRFVVEFSK